MKIASLVVRVHPNQREGLAGALRDIPGVEVHGANADLGRLIVTVEDGDGYAMTDSLLAVSVAPQVLGVTLAYEYSDEGLQIEGELPAPLPACGTATGAQDKEAVK